MSSYSGLQSTRAGRARKPLRHRSMRLATAAGDAGGNAWRVFRRRVRVHRRLVRDLFLTSELHPRLGGRPPAKSNTTLNFDGGEAIKTPLPNRPAVIRVGAVSSRRPMQARVPKSTPLPVFSEPSLPSAVDSRKCMKNDPWTRSIALLDPAIAPAAAGRPWPEDRCRRGFVFSRPEGLRRPHSRSPCLDQEATRARLDNEHP